MIAAAPPRTVHVEHCMGTVFSIDIRTPGEWAGPIGEAVAWLHHVDAVFSTYRDASDVSRIRRGELRVGDAHPDVATVLDLCAHAQLASGGAFTAMPGGALDPSGIVKGWAVERAAALLRDHGARDVAVNGGGDVQVAGEAAPGRPWGIGIADPHRPGGVLTVVEAGRGGPLAVATSGVAERGLHIVDPFTGRAATAVASATVTGPSLTHADAYATAAVVLGQDALRWVDTLPGHAALLVLADGRCLTSAAWRGSGANDHVAV